MKHSFMALGTLATTLAVASLAQAGALSFHAITSDADSDISTSNVYTTAVNYGNGGDVTINGVTFTGAPSNGTTSIVAPGATYTATGILGDSSFIFYTSPIADGENVKSLLADYFFIGEDKNTDPSTLALSGLTAGETYDLRVYVRPIGVNWNRPVTLDFTGDGATTSLVGYWDNANGGVFGYNEDAPSTVGFANGDQAYYINYQYTYDGVSTPGFTAISSFGGQGLIMYGISNQVAVPEPASLGLLAGAGMFLLGRRRA